MKWPFSRARVCTECGVYFEPVNGCDPRYSSLCSTHAKEALKFDTSKDAFMRWAMANYARLSKMMAEEQAKKNQAQSANLSALAGAAMAMQGNSGPYRPNESPFGLGGYNQFGGLGI